MSPLALLRRRPHPAFPWFQAVPLHHCARLITLLILACLASSPVSAAIADVDTLALDADYKAVLDKQIRPHKYTEQRVQALHDLLFYGDGYGYGIQYQGEHTRTAMETLHARGGNCVSLANLFVASARYLGMKAVFQESQVPQDWQDEDNLLVVPGHINVLVRINASTALTVEFLGTYRGHALKTRVISDNEALAQYYSNLGMEQLIQNNLELAGDYLRKALESHDKHPMLWSNMGVIQRRQGNLKAAEAAYLRALKYDKRYITATKNLYVLYSQLGETRKAAKYAAQVERYNRRNPYYLHQLAKDALREKNFGEARDLLKQAINIKSDEDKFHFTLARLYYLNGELDRSAEAMETAKRTADDQDRRQLYHAKLQALRAIIET